MTNTQTNRIQQLPDDLILHIRSFMTERTRMFYDMAESNPGRYVSDDEIMQAYIDQIEAEAEEWEYDIDIDEWDQMYGGGDFLVEEGDEVW